MKKNVSKVLALFLVFAVFMTSGVSAFAETSDVVGQKESVIAQAKPIPVSEQNNGDIQDILLKSATVSGISTTVLDKDTQDDLETLGISVDNVKKAETMKDVIGYTNEIYTKYIIDDESYISVDSNNQIVDIYHADADLLAPTWEETFSTSEEQYIATGEQTLEMLELEGEYKLVKSEKVTVDYWLLAYRQVLENGLVNECDGVNITIARKDASLAFLSTFDLEANTTTAEISKEEAIVAAQPVIEKLQATVDGAELCYVQPNYYWREGGPYEPADFVRLAYNISLNGGNQFVYVDAVTGEVIGGNVMMLSAGAYGDGYMSESSSNVSLAKAAFKRLGYSATGTTSKEYSLKNTIMSFLKKSDAYGFMFYGHGDNDVICAKDTKDDIVWSLNRTTIDGYNGNWKFVFLSACETGTPAWASAFNITSNSQDRFFMGFYNTVKVTNMRQYNREFWPQVNGSRYLYTAAVNTRNSLSTLDLPLYCLGDKTYNGKV